MHNFVQRLLWQGKRKNKSGNSQVHFPKELTVGERNVQKYYQGVKIRAWRKQALRFSSSLWRQTKPWCHDEVVLTPHPKHSQHPDLPRSEDRKLVRMSGPERTFLQGNTRTHISVQWSFLQSCSRGSIDYNLSYNRFGPLKQVARLC